MPLPSAACPLARLLVVACMAGFAAPVAAKDLGEFDAFASIQRLKAGLDHPTSVSSRLRTLPAPTGAAKFNAVADPTRSARAFLDSNARRLGAGVAGAEVLVDVDHQVLGSGAHLVRFQPQRGGIEIFRESLNVLLDTASHVRAVSGMVEGAGEELPAPDGRRGFALAAADAAALALEPYGLAPTATRSALHKGEPQGAYTRFSVAGNALTRVDGLRVKPVYYRMPDGLVPAYYVETVVASPVEASADYYAQVFAADDGRLLHRHNQTQDAFTYRVFAENGGILLPFPGPQRRGDLPHPDGAPTGFAAPLQPAQLVTLDYAPLIGVFPAASGFADPWLPGGATETIGNNADAYLDLTAPDGFNAGDQRAAVSAPGVFDLSYNFTLQPGADLVQKQAAVLQQFYVVNYLHDWFYQAGFTETAGNAQTNNYGRGGLENDSLRAEGQDYGGTNNANMSTPADGSQPRMQMYVFSGPADVGLTFNPEPTGNILAQPAAFGPGTFDITGAVVAGQDGSGVSTDGCEALTNNVAGMIVLLDRGTCNFTVKVKNAQNAGAIGALIANNVPNGLPPMGGADATVTIPSLGISQADGAAVRSALGIGGVQVHLFRGQAIDRDGTIDTGIIAHEWGHYISNRLIANSSGLGNQQGGGMGEGWADFHALLLLVKQEDLAVPGNASFGGTYATGGYVTAGLYPSNSTNSAYFGIRRYPYSTDLTKNALTFTHISDGVSLPATTPMSPRSFSAQNSEVHNAGEVWASMLWECYAGLLGRTLDASPPYDFIAARRRMSEYLVAGYKLTPADPTFTEARDALFAAIAAVDPQDLAVCAAGFAKRGAGLFAASPDRYSTDLVGVTESYVTGGNLQVDDIALVEDAGCDHDGVLDLGEHGHLRVTVSNTGTAALDGSTVSLTTGSAGISFPRGPTATIAHIAALEQATVDVPVLLAAATNHESITFTASPSNPAIPNATGQGMALSAPIAVDFDAVPAASAADGFETGTWVWTTSLSAGLDSAAATWRRALEGTNYVASGPDVGALGTTALVSPALQVAASGSFGFTFQARYQFEQDQSANYDGGVIEVSTDGNSWSPVPGSALTPTYGGALSNCCGNPLTGRSAFVGQSAGYPALITHSVDLGTAYAGQTVWIRFVVATDPATGGAGWQIDDVAFTGVMNAPFPSVLPDQHLCEFDSVFASGFE